MSPKALSERETEAVAHLETLAAALTEKGFRATLDAASRTPALLVQNPGVSALNEHVIAAPDGRGAWWYWWPWAERIVPVIQATDAAGAIAHVLRTDSHDRGPSAANIAPEGPRS